MASPASRHFGALMAFGLAIVLTVSAKPHWETGMHYAVSCGWGKLPDGMQ